MSEKKTNILLVEDEESHADLICRSFEPINERVSVTVERNLNEARSSIAKSTPDLIIADYVLPDGKGIELIPANKAESPYPIVIMTSHGDEKVAVDAMKAGALDYIVKSEVTLDNMPRTCERIMREWNHTIKHKKAEEALKKSEEKYRKLIETAQDAIVCDINGKITDWNKSAERVFGYSKDEIMGKPVNVLIPDRYKNEHQEGFERFLKTGEARIIGKTVEVSGLTKEGVEIPIEISITYQRLEKEQHFFTAIIRNITDRKQAEKKLKESETKIRSIVSSLYEAAIVIYDRDGRITALWGTPEMDKRYSIYAVDVVGRSIREFVPPEQVEQRLTEIHRVFDAGEKMLVEYMVSVPGGNFWHETSLSPMCDTNGSITAVVGFIRDITERKKTEQQLRKLSHAVKYSSTTIFITDTKGNIEYANPEFTQLTGYSIEEVIGKNPRLLQSGVTSPEVYKELWETISSGNEWRGEFCNRKKNGELYWESASISPVKDEKDVITNFIAVKGNITERKRLEEALLQSEKLKSIGTITAGISHEFNNILAIISGNVQLLEASYKNHEELTKALRTIKRATNDGAQISRRMLKFTKTSEDTTGFVPFDINELINQAIDFTMPRWKNMAQAKGINYHMDTEGMKRVPSILCDPTEIREILVNIINNALDAMPDDGRITFRAWSGDDIVFISISDTGEGMSEEVKKNIFDPFFTTKTAVGTGLGMSTAYGILTGHGGKIEVESEVGKGTTFTLQFPADTKADSPNKSSEPEQEIMNKCLRILVVDDEEEICNILEEFFSEKGHLVRTVDNGREAIVLAKIDDYDLVLCDLAMPNVYGYDVIKALNKLEKKPKIGIITGWRDKLKPPEEEWLKVDFIIKKPFEFSKLTKQINELFI